MSANNHSYLLGRLTKDPIISGDGNSKVARLTIAVQRNYKNADGEYLSDFISCVGFGKTADHIEKFYHKGSPASILGRIQTGSYKNKDGQTVYTTDVAIDDISFVPGSKDSDTKSESKSESKSNSTKEVNSDDDFMNIAAGEAEDLPW